MKIRRTGFKVATKITNFLLKNWEKFSFEGRNGCFKEWNLIIIKTMMLLWQNPLQKPFLIIFAGGFC